MANIYRNNAQFLNVQGAKITTGGKGRLYIAIYPASSYPTDYTNNSVGQVIVPGRTSITIAVDKLNGPSTITLYRGTSAPSTTATQVYLGYPTVTEDDNYKYYTYNNTSNYQDYIFIYTGTGANQFANYSSYILSGIPNWGSYKIYKYADGSPTSIPVLNSGNRKINGTSRYQSGYLMWTYTTSVSGNQPLYYIEPLEGGSTITIATTASKIDMFGGTDGLNFNYGAYSATLSETIDGVNYFTYTIPTTMGNYYWCFTNNTVSGSTSTAVGINIISVSTSVTQGWYEISTHKRTSGAWD